MNQPISNSSSAEIRQVAAVCTCFNLRKAARAVTQRFDEALKPSGLLATQFTILTAVAIAGAGTMTELAQILVMDRTTLTRNLKPLEREGLISIEPGQDKRVRIICLTAKGQNALAQALPLWKQVQNSVQQGLGQDKWTLLLAHLADTTALVAKL
jgi:DNA-binding MarR family transcriptional regulator